MFDEEQADKMKEEFSGKMDSFIHKWSEASDKWLKEAEPEEDFEDLIEKPEVKPIKKKKARQKSEKMKIICDP
ncbi:MAG: hypothetical protein Q8M95_07140 [Candidatus Methanoperedens sp.]|nr:hypothetical protein [Candidatus Methanoperedens sp.]